LERLVLEADRRPEILAKGNPRADPRSIQEGSSSTATGADTDLQTVNICLSCPPVFVSCLLPEAISSEFDAGGDHVYSAELS
jgi:hypothetical protein